MKIWYSRYYLKLKNRVNLRARADFRIGALLKVEFADGKVGHSDLNPWPEFNEADLDQCLLSLRTGNYTKRVARSLHFAAWDAEARSTNQSLFSSEPQVANHLLVGDLRAIDENLLGTARDSGFTKIKFKVNGSTENLDHTLKILDVAQGNFQFRLDFNFALNNESAMTWFTALEEYSDAIDFIEDPLPYDQRLWSQLREGFSLDLAADWVDFERVSRLAADYVIIKPSVDESEQLIEQYAHQVKGFVFTHCMDHPLGHVAAAASAEKYRDALGERSSDCGLLWNDFLEASPYSERLSVSGPYFNKPNGVGLGYDELLEREDWVDL